MKYANNSTNMISYMPHIGHFINSLIPYCMLSTRKVYCLLPKTS